MEPVEAGRRAWHQMLREARASTRMSRPALAELSGVSQHTIKSYELGVRNPSRPLLVKLLDTLKLDRTIRTPILEAAGFVSDAEQLRPNQSTYWYALEDAIETIRVRRWPACIMSEMMEVLSANRLLLQVWGVSAEDNDVRAPQNLLARASDPRFARQIVNWDELVSVGLAVMKGHHRGSEASVEGSSPAVGAAMAKFMSGDPKLVAHAFELFEKVQPQFPKIRYSYNVVWKHPSVGLMRFEVLVTTANDFAGFTFQDWIPIDAETWVRLETLKGSY